MAANKKSTPAPTKAAPVEKVVNAPPMKTAAPPMKTAAPVTETALAPATLNPGGLSNSAPAWLQKRMGTEAPRGLEKVDTADIIMPRLVLAQAMSPEVANAAENGYGIQVGDIFDNLSKQVLCKAGQELEFIPVVLGKSRMHLGDLDKGEGILCRADDAIKARPGGDGKDEGGNPTTDCGKCILKEWDEEEGRPQCSLFYNFILLLPQLGMMRVVWSNKHTNVKVAKRFISTAASLNADFFAQKYTLKTVTEKSDKYTYKNFDFKPVGWVSEQEYSAAERFYASLKGKTWTPDTSDVATEVNSERATQNAAPEPGSDADEPTPTNAAPPAAGGEEDAF